MQSSARRIIAVKNKAFEAMKKGVQVTDISEFDKDENFPPEDIGKVLRMIDSANKAINSFREFLKSFDTRLFFKRHFEHIYDILEDFAYELYDTIYNNLVNVDEVLCDDEEGVLINATTGRYFMTINYKDRIPYITLYPAEACNKVVREDEIEEESQQ